MINYRTLLRKYINHVIEEEGTDFLSIYPKAIFTDEEYKELVKLSKDND